MSCGAAFSRVNGNTYLESVVTKRVKAFGVAIVLVVVAAGFQWLIKTCCAPPPLPDCCALPPEAAPLDSAGLRKAVGDAIVGVEVRFGGARPVVRTGTGFIVNKEGRIATAGALFDRPAGPDRLPVIVVTLRDGSRLSGEILKLGEGMALIKVNYPRTLTAVSLKSEPAVGTGAVGYLAGFHLPPETGSDGQPMFVRSQVHRTVHDSLAGDVLLIKADAGLEFLGAPLLDQLGGVVGVAVRRDSTGLGWWTGIPIGRLVGAMHLHLQVKPLAAYNDAKTTNHIANKTATANNP